MHDKHGVNILAAQNVGRQRRLYSTSYLSYLVGVLLLPLRECDSTVVDVRDEVGILLDSGGCIASSITFHPPGWR
jgi:hypothetical protein